MKIKFGQAGTAEPAGSSQPVPAETTPADSLPQSGTSAPAAGSPPQYSPPAVPPAAAVPAVRQAPAVVDDDRITFEDLRIPSMSIVHGVGDLSTLFNAGSIVYDGKHLLSASPPKKGDTTTPAQVATRIVVIGFRPTRYAEKVGGGESGRILSSLSDVAACGGTTVYKEAYVGESKAQQQVRPYFQPLASALVLIESPADFPASDVETVFPLSCRDGETVRHFAIGFWHLRGTAHTAAARPLKTARSLGVLRAAPGYKARWISVNTALKPFGSNVAFVPEIRIGGDTSAEIRELAQSALDALSRPE